MDSKPLCTTLFDKHSKQFGWLSGSATSVLRALPYGCYALIPSHYFWAMVAANLPIEYAGKRKFGPSLPGNHFLC